MGQSCCMGSQSDTCSLEDVKQGTEGAVTRKTTTVENIRSPEPLQTSLIVLDGGSPFKAGTPQHECMVAATTGCSGNDLHHHINTTKRRSDSPGCSASAEDISISQSITPSLEMCVVLDAHHPKSVESPKPHRAKPMPEFSSSIRARQNPFDQSTRPKSAGEIALPFMLPRTSSCSFSSRRSIPKSCVRFHEATTVFLEADGGGDGDYGNTPSADTEVISSPFLLLLHGHGEHRLPAGSTVGSFQQQPQHISPPSPASLAAPLAVQQQLVVQRSHRAGLAQPTLRLHID